MMAKQAGRLFWGLAVIYGMSFNVFAATVADPCGGPSTVLNLVDRPTNADSICAIPFKQVMLEAGYRYLQLFQPTTYLQNFPETELRVGLPARSEIAIILPNYFHQSAAPRAGNSATTVSLKHELGYTQSWHATLEALITPPSRNKSFGSDGLGSTVNAIIIYAFNSQYTLTFVLGGSTQTLSSYYGGQRFNSINPDLVFTWLPNEKFEIETEVYGQTRTAPGQGSGFNADVAFLYQVRPSVEIDMELGQRISGYLGPIQHYVGTGIAVLFA